MASYNRCPTGWRVRIRKGGQVHTATFPLKAQCVEWATAVEADIISGKLGRIPEKTFGDLVTRYKQEITPTKRGERAENLRLDRAINGDLGKVRLAELSPAHVTEWRDKRLAAVSAASVNREWNTLCHACNVAIKNWKWLRENPFSIVKRPPDPPPRQRLITQAEIDAILHVCGDDYRTAMGRVGLAFSFALETAMRAGEICDLRWENVLATHVHVRQFRDDGTLATKTGLARDVPLSSAAIAIIEKVRKERGPVFNLTSATLDALFRKAKLKACVSGFTFHDSRGNALTRLSKVLNVLQLARISGHRDLRILQQVYYRETAADIAALIG